MAQKGKRYKLDKYYISCIRQMSYTSNGKTLVIEVIKRFLYVDLNCLPFKLLLKNGNKQLL